jgi:P27 family predicted phage terminase small subunit
MKIPEKNKAPNRLGAEARRWWERIMDEYGIEDAAGLLLLQTALEAFERMRAAQATIKQDGATIADRWGQIKPHPLLVTERDSRSQMIQALKALNLDLEPLRDAPGRR